MKTYIRFFIFLFAAIQLNCTASKYHNFIKTSKQSNITLKGISRPYIVFVLESGDTIRFSKKDVHDIINQHLKNEIKRWGYSSSPHLVTLTDKVKRLKVDTVVYQNLSAIGIEKISDNLDSWIARELLLQGKAEILTKDKKQKIEKLKYIYNKDILGGEQGTFYSINNKDI